VFVRKMIRTRMPGVPSQVPIGLKPSEVFVRRPPWGPSLSLHSSQPPQSAWRLFVATRPRCYYKRAISNVQTTSTMDLRKKSRRRRSMGKRLARSTDAEPKQSRAGCCNHRPMPRCVREGSAGMHRIPCLACSHLFFCSGVRPYLA